MLTAIDAPLILMVDSIAFALTIFALQARFSFLSIPKKKRSRVQHYYYFASGCAALGVFYIFAILAVLLTYIDEFGQHKGFILFMAFYLTLVGFSFMAMAYCRYVMLGDRMDREIHIRRWKD